MPVTIKEVVLPPKGCWKTIFGDKIGVGVSIRGHHIEVSDPQTERFARQTVKVTALHVNLGDRTQVTIPLLTQLREEAKNVINDGPNGINVI